MIVTITPQTLRKTILLGGDFNAPEIDWEIHTVIPQAKEPIFTQDKRNIIDNQGLIQAHTEPARASNVLDLFFTNNPSLVKNSRSIPGIGDHDMVLINFDIKPHINKTKPRHDFKRKKADQ